MNIEDELADRAAEVERLFDSRAATHGFALTVDAEDGFLLTDAVRSYRNAADAATILCCHAASERDLAALVAYETAPPRHAARWGLGALIPHCRSEALVSPDVLDPLEVLNSNRKALYHFGHADSADGLIAQTGEYIQEVGSGSLYALYEERYEERGGAKEVYTMTTGIVMRRNAHQALRAAFGLRAWFGRRLYPET